MKFKKVEIQAFRAYNLVEEGTFDFGNGKQTADFVSIYAPNGFGKTSFYDAVEWGITNNIHRFLKRDKNNKQAAKSEKNINTFDQTHILRNKFADDSLPAFVNLYTTASDRPIINELKKPRKGQPDYKFDERDTVRGYFQEVILSQEWIDSFLKEDNGEQRYQTFIKYFGDKELDRYHKALVALIKANEEKVRALKIELDGFQLDLAFDGDQKIMSEVNAVISQLNSRGQKLNLLDNNFNEQESAIYSSIITSGIHLLESKIEQSKNLLDKATQLTNGNEELDSLEQYGSNLSGSRTIMKEIEDTQSIIIDFKELASVLNQLDAIIKTKAELGSIRSLYENLLPKVPIYEELSRIISLSNKIEQESRLILSSLGKQKVDHESGLQQNREKAQSITFQIAKVNALLNTIPDIEKNLEQKEQRRAELSDLIAKANDESKIAIERQKAVELQLYNFDNFIQKAQQNQYDPPTGAWIDKYKSSIQELLQIQEGVTTIAEELKKLTTSIQGQKNFQSEISELTTKGLSIVNELQSNTCPLCTQTYQSYKELADKIASSDMLDASLQVLLKEQNDSGHRLTLARSEELHKKEALLKMIKRDRQHEAEKVKTLQDEVIALQNRLVDLERQKVTIIEDLSTLKASIQNLTVEKYQSKLQDEVAGLNAENKILNDTLANLQQNVSETNEKIASEQQKIEQARESTKQSKENPIYKEVNEYRNSLTVDEQNNFSSVLVKILADANINKMHEVGEKEDQLQKDIAALQNKTSSFSEDEINKQLMKLHGQATSLSQRINEYRDYLKTAFRLEAFGGGMEEAASYIKSVRDREYESIEEHKKTISLFKLLGKHKEQLIPFLRYQIAVSKEQDIKARIKFLKTRVQDELIDEKRKVTEHINAQINSFFYENIINDLYRKIDPHPEYKEIQFKCDFTDDKPQLNVCVTDEKREVFQIPNLYFSTAQLNILSLSIFLAKALHAVDDQGNQLECIFIDDPIQSMDSINILSTIDLLRSIVVNNKRQIILSTHDANFHNLLRKKIPEELFNSKFMELETFGKVKAVTV
ncbi:hypothetical protein [Flavobacterium sp.]|uniref:hypothetical protein n=1 Tax=Flavobacterium sp. TaxID=239 RepID=UPI0040336DA9